jgi:hypothetical protein
MMRKTRIMKVMMNKNDDKKISRDMHTQFYK